MLNPLPASMLYPVTATAPAAWASFLINGDPGELEPAQLAAARNFVECELGGDPVSSEPAGFLWRPDSFRYWPEAADCEAFTALVEMESHA